MSGIHGTIFLAGRILHHILVSNRLGYVRARWLDSQNAGADISMKDVGSTFESGNGRSAVMGSVDSAAKLLTARRSRYI